MATKQPTVALVLRDEPALGLRAGQLIQARAALIAQLAASGAADPHPETVAHAQQTGAPEIRLT